MEVTEVNSPMHDDLVKYTLSDGTQIISTFDHPYYIQGLKLASYKPKWTNERYDELKEVLQINVGDKFIKPNRENLEIVSIEELERINTQTHIITVAQNHNFYANGVLVHNK
jgi:intein/homing endonuclease